MLRIQREASGQVVLRINGRLDVEGLLLSQLKESAGLVSSGGFSNEF